MRPKRRPLVEQRARMPARPEGLNELHALFDRFFAEAEASGTSIPSEDRVALRTAGGELAANIVEHACKHVPGARVALALVAFPDRVELVFEDSGAPYAERGTHDLDELPQGGMGLRLVDASVHTVEYQRSGTTNRWCLVQFSRR